MLRDSLTTLGFLSVSSLTTSQLIFWLVLNTSSIWVDRRRSVGSALAKSDSMLPATINACNVSIFLGRNMHTFPPNEQWARELEVGIHLKLLSDEGLLKPVNFFASIILMQKFFLKIFFNKDIICFMRIEAKIFSVGELVCLKSGYPFRGSVEEVVDGNALVVQMKDVDPEHGVSWSGVTRTGLAGRKQPDWLNAGDVLFAFKGGRFYAVCIDEPPSPTVCSPQLFHLQVVPQAPLMPAFLAWQINQPPFQRQLQQAAEGSSQLSIRRPVLESLSFCVPPLADQQRIVALADLVIHERRVLQQLINNRELELQALAEDLAHSAQIAN